MKVKPFSILNRAEQIKTLASEKFDLVIIGGGVTGAGIALDAASRGMKTCLIEKNDFASGKVTIFVGAGISTESKNVLPETFYDEVSNELNIDGTIYDGS